MVPLSLGKTVNEELVIAQQRELLLALTAGQLWRLLPVGNALRDLCACRDAQCPRATQQGSMGSPWAAAMEFLPNQPCAAPSLARDLD